MTPEMILLTLCCATGVLILLRFLLSRSPKPMAGPDLGASMSIGNREVQEDCYETVDTPSGHLMVLADGMGKAYGGRIASRTAVDVFVDLFQDYNAFDNPQYYFRKAFAAANRSILNTLENERRGCASVGAAMMRDGWLYYAGVGNVKLCVFRGGDLVPLSAGHTLDVLAEQSFRTGRLTREDALVLLENKRLYNYVGQDGFQNVELLDRPIALKQGDIVVLMSDGVYDLLPWREIEDVLAVRQDCQSMAYQIIEKVNQDPTEEKDNASIVLLRWSGKETLQ